MHSQAPIPKAPHTLRLLHTSDWHLGRRLYNQNRDDEFHRFLSWLVDVIKQEQVDILVVAGDVFDTTTPSNHAQTLYYRFLNQVAHTDCQHVVIIAGNHDSPSCLETTKPILHALNTHVIGSPSTQSKDDILTLYDDKGTPQAIIVAVPYLRDRDIRTSGSTDSLSQKIRNSEQGIKQHYHHLAMLAKDAQNQLYQTHQIHVPIIATGHLFVAGAHVSSDDDGMRDLQVGTLGQMNADIFADCLDYVALGHIHAAQKVAGKEHIRYSGSPIAMGFGEADKTKHLLLVDFYEKTPKITPLAIPVFQTLVRITGDYPHIKNELKKLIAKQTAIWVEIIYQGLDEHLSLVSDIRELTKDSQIKVLNIQNKTLYQKIFTNQEQHIQLTQLNELEVFHQFLTQNHISDLEKQALTDAYKTTLLSLQDES